VTKRDEYIVGAKKDKYIVGANENIVGDQNWMKIL
jgi:hypothetical protein